MRYSFIYNSACLLFLVLLSSFLVGPQTTFAQKPAKQPKFIKGMYLNGHNKVTPAENAVEPGKYPEYVEVRKAPEPPEFMVHEPEPVTTEETVPKQPVVIEKPVIIKYTTPAVKKDQPEENKPFDMVSDDLVETKYADMIGIDRKDISNRQLYRFIDKWYGTNYRLGGHTEEGIDCSGFAQKLYEDVFGMELTRTAMDQYKNSTREKHRDNATEGDLVFFRQHGKRITHVGVYLANDFFVHSSTSQGVVISSLKEEYWHKHYVGIGKMKKEEQSGEQLLPQ